MINQGHGTFFFFLDAYDIHQFLANAGEVVNVFLAILIGSMSLVLLSPELQGMSASVYCMLFYLRKNSH